MSFKTFFYAYIECALWSSTDNVNGEDIQLDAHAGEIAKETFQTLKTEALDFYQAHEEQWRGHIDDSQAGHDFWLTRNGHGAGFWDRDLGELGEQLSAASAAFGNMYLYIGDDGKIYV